MIIINPHKYLVRDCSYQNECQKIITDIEKKIESDSLFAYVSAKESSEKLGIILKKNNEDYTKYYFANRQKFNTLKERISWDMILPYTDFEASVKPIIDQINTLLNEKNYRLNNQSRDKLVEIEELIIKYIKKTGLIDYSIRNQVHNKLNEVKRNLTNDSLISMLMSEKPVKEIELLFLSNSEQFKKKYLKIIKKIEVLKISFEKSKSYFSIKEAKIIEDQFKEINSIMDSQSYDNFEDAHDILDVIDLKLAEIKNDKKVKIGDNLKRELDSLKTIIWSEDWIQIKNAVDKLIEEADKTGILYKLNFDKFNIDQKKTDKKDSIYEFIKSIQGRNTLLFTSAVSEARELLSREASKTDLEKIKFKCNRSPAAAKTSSVETFRPTGKKQNFMYIILGILLIAAAAIYIINNVKSEEHYDMKGQKYADFVENIVFNLKKNGAEINSVKIRKKISAPEKELRIISIDDKCVTIEFKSKIFKKDLRKF